MISGHYWPHLTFDSAGRDVRLADALRRTGMAIEVLTPRYASSWPEQLMHREIPVHRPVAAARSQWSIGRYLRHLESWLTQHADRFDVLFCTSLREEVIPVIQTASRSGARTVLQHSGTGAAADHLTWTAMRRGRRLRTSLQRADAIIVNWASVQRDLTASGISPQRLQRIDLGVIAGATPPPRQQSAADTASLATSRIALAAINRDLALDRDSLVVLTCGRMSRTGGMMTLAKAASGLIDIWPDLRLWLVGDGDLREDLHGYFRHQGIRQNIAMPGTFVDFEDLFRVADLLVVPSPADALEDTLMAAIAAAVPAVVVDSTDTRALFSGSEHAVGWFAENDVATLRAAIRAALVDLPARRDAAQQLRREMLRRRPYESTVQRYKQLFDSLAETIPHRPVAGAALRSRSQP